MKIYSVVLFLVMSLPLGIFAQTFDSEWICRYSTVDAEPNATGNRTIAVGSYGVSLTQFLMEAVILSLLGGIVGIILGVAVGNYAGSLLEATAVIPYDWVVIGVLLCIIIGVTFGTYPAFKAANLDPIEALRYE